MWAVGLIEEAQVCVTYACWLRFAGQTLVGIVDAGATRHTASLDQRKNKNAAIPEAGHQARAHPVDMSLALRDLNEVI